MATAIIFKNSKELFSIDNKKLVLALRIYLFSINTNFIINTMKFYLNFRNVKIIIPYLLLAEDCLLDLDYRSSYEHFL